MRHTGLLLLLYFCFCPNFSSAQESHLDVQKYLESTLLDHVLILRNFPDDNHIEYDEKGSPTSIIHIGAWTTAKIEIKEVKVDAEGIKLEGPRVFTIFNDKNGKFENGRIHENYRLLLRMDSRSRDQAALDSALARIFIRTDRDFIDAVPDYWRPFLLGRVRKDKDGKPELPNWPSEQKPSVNGGPQVVEANAPLAITGLKRRNSVAPNYPPAARRLGLQGDVAFETVIDSNGTVAQMAVIKPLGAGFEEAALAAIRKWTYTPAVLDGRPVEVKTTIEVHFQIAR